MLVYKQQNCEPAIAADSDCRAQIKQKHGKQTVHNLYGYCSERALYIVTVIVGLYTDSNNCGPTNSGIPVFVSLLRLAGAIVVDWTPLVRRNGRTHQQHMLINSLILRNSTRRIK